VAKIKSDGAGGSWREVAWAYVLGFGPLGTS